MHVKGQNRDLGTLFPERLDDLIGDDTAVRVIDAFVDSTARPIEIARIGGSRRSLQTGFSGLW